MVRSQARSNSPKGLWGRLWPLVALCFLAAALGPKLIFDGGPGQNLSLAGGLWRLDYASARAGFFLSWLEIEGLKLTRLQSPLSLEAGRLRLEGLWRLKILSLWRKPVAQLAPGPLAERISAQNLRAEGQGFSLNLSDLEAGGLALAKAEDPNWPWVLKTVRFKDLSVQATDWKWRLAWLQGSGLGWPRTEALALGSLRGWSEDATAMELQIESLALRGLKSADLRALILTPPPLSTLPWLLSLCEELQAKAGSWRQNGRETLRLLEAVFSRQPQVGEGFSFSRQLKLELELEAMAKLFDSRLWADLRAAEGPRARLDFDLQAQYQSSNGVLTLKQARLWSPSLGHLSLGGRLTGLKLIRPWLSPSQLLFVNSLFLEELELDFQDTGLGDAVYRHLKNNFWPSASRAEIAQHMESLWLEPSLAQPRSERLLSNLPQLATEARAFIRQPQSLRLTAAPQEPFPLLALLATADYYDIIKQLNLTLEVNQRPPVALQLRSSLSEDQLPSSPQDLENMFEQNDRF